jgi:tetraacyldisaccharide 4'-kinase
MKLLLPFAWLYALAIATRNKLFDWGVLKVEGVGVPVISVGNLTVGGTGKTPLVEYIVGLLVANNRRVAIVSRGYKRASHGVVVVSDGNHLLVDASQGGDEPVQMARRFASAIVVVGEKRVDAARRAVELGADSIVLDDAFQHRSLKRDLDIVVIDATKDITQDAMLPAGTMREPLSGVGRANVVAFSKVDEAGLSQRSLDSKPAQDVGTPMARIRSYFDGAFISYRYRVQDVRRAHDNGSTSFDIVRRMRLLAFSGIGRHDAFIHELTKNGFVPVSDMRFSDHHEFSDGDVATLASFAKAMSADGCITTEKDIVRLRANRKLAEKLFDEIPVFYLTIDVEIVEGREVFHSLIEHCTRQ